MIFLFEWTKFLSMVGLFSESNQWTHKWVGRTMTQRDDILTKECDKDTGGKRIHDMSKGI